LDAIYKSKLPHSHPAVPDVVESSTTVILYCSAVWKSSIYIYRTVVFTSDSVWKSKLQLQHYNENRVNEICCHYYTRFDTHFAQLTAWSQFVISLTDPSLKLVCCYCVYISLCGVCRSTEHSISVAVIRSAGWRYSSYHQWSVCECVQYECSLLRWKQRIHGQ